MLQLIRYILMFIFISYHCTAFSQIKKGMNYLKEKKYSAAKVAFQVDLNNPLKSVAAKLGLADCYNQERKNISSLTKGLDYLIEAKTTYTSLKPKDKQSLIKYGVSLNKLSIIEKDLQKNALKQVSIINSVLLLDTIIAKITPATIGIRRDLERIRVKIVNDAVKNATDYLTLTSLIQNHFRIITTTNYRNKLDIQAKLFGAFIKDKDFGLKKLERFVQDHPRHAFSIDCWVNEFIAAVKNDDPRALIEFLIIYPNSLLDNYASIILKIRTDGGDYIPSEYSLNNSEKQHLETLKEYWEFEEKLEDTEGFLRRSSQESFLAYLEKTAPTSRVFYFMQTVLQKYLTNRHWKSAINLINTAQKIFLDFQPEGCKTRFAYYSKKQSWFKVGNPIINRKTENIFKIPVNEVNTSRGDEFSPLITSDGKTLYFSANYRDNQIGGEDIYKAHFNVNHGTWSPPELVTSLCSTGDESPLSITSDGNQLLLFRDKKLHISILEKNGWSVPTPLPENINQFSWIGRATFSSDGSVMVFSASENAKELYEKENIDLYFTKKDINGNWMNPKPLSVDINTFENERSPFLYNDNKTLYFSSNGHKGLGEMDIFYTKRLDDTWTNWSVPKNLGKEINTLEDDWGYNFSISLAGNKVYISSDDIQTKLGDIYTTKLPDFANPKNQIICNGLVLNNCSNVDFSTVSIIDIESRKEIKKIKTRPDGSFSFVVNPELKISYHVENKNIYPISRILNSKYLSKNPYFVDTLSAVCLKDQEIPVQLNTILFDFNTAVLKAQSYPELDRFYLILDNKEWSIDIIGHTDNIGSPEYNKLLSLKRATAVKTFLKQKGIDDNRIRTFGFGAKYPLANNLKEEGRAKNRRVEIKLKTISKR